MWTLAEIAFWATLAYFAPRSVPLYKYARPTALIMTASCCVGFMLNELIYPITVVALGVENLLFASAIDFMWVLVLLAFWFLVDPLYRAKHLMVVYFIAILIRLMTYDAIITELPGVGYREYFVWQHYSELLIATDLLAMLIFFPEVFGILKIGWFKLCGKKSHRISPS